jgi:hypothetical protein
MGIAPSLLLIAVGAVLRFAVHVSTSGFNLHTIGIILMIVGVIGLLLTLVWMFGWSERRERTRYVEREPPLERESRL